MNQPGTSLASMLAPYTLDGFMADIYERRPLHLPRNDRGHFADLLADLHVEQQIWRHGQQWGDVSLARADLTPAQNSYQQRTPTLDTIAAAYADGYTVVVNNYQDKSAAVAACCRSVEQYFHFRCNANLYMTGPNRRGLNAHYDDQDVFVLQLDGAKTWRLIEGGPALPLEQQPYHCPDPTDGPYRDVTLAPGDLLYLPRGVIHMAHTTTSASVHLTLSLAAVRHVTLLMQLLQQAALNVPALRKSMTCGHMPEAGPAAADLAALGALLARSGQAGHERARAALEDQFLHGLKRLPTAFHLPGASLADIDADTVLTVAPDQICLLSETERAVTLKFIGGQIPLTDELVDAARFIYTATTFRVADIGGGLSAPQQLAFADFLLRSGLLAVANTAD